MARRQYKGNSQQTAITSPMASGDLSMTVADGSTLPTGTSPFVLTIDLGATGEEKMLCTARTGNSITIGTRGYDGTTAAAHATGAVVRHTLSAVDLDEANAHINATSAAHAATAISNTPAGTVAATTVQAAINELDTEKLSTATAATTYVPQPASPVALNFIRRNAANNGFEYATVSTPLLAKTQYAPAVAVSYAASTTALTLTVMDTTNLTVTFTAPTSGSVLMRLSGYLVLANASVPCVWGLVTHGGTTLVAPVALVAGGATTPTGPKSVAILVTGLTPGNSYQWDWVHAQGTTASLSLIAQGYQTQVGAVLSAAPTGTPAVMEVWSA